MFKRLVLASLIALPIAAVAGGGSAFVQVAHASGNSGTLTGRVCSSTTYTPPPPPSFGIYYLRSCHDLGFDDDSGVNDSNTGYSNQVGTISFVNFGCRVPSIVDGRVYYTFDGQEYDSYNPNTNTSQLRLQCQVQTLDTVANGTAPGSTLFAYIYDSEFESGTGDEHTNYLGARDTKASYYETESTSGVVTMHLSRSFTGTY